MKIIFGIGNPGPKYDGTRHNVGFDVLDDLGETYGGTFRPGRCQGLEASVHIDGTKTLLVKPTTYVNLTGTCVSGILNWYKEDPTNILVVTDCVSIPVGKIRLRPKGSAGGHNGLRSIIAALGEDFARLRIGIAPDGERDQGVRMKDFVLSRFDKCEEEEVEEALRRAADCAVAWISQDVDRVMQQFN